MFQEKQKENLKTQMWDILALSNPYKTSCSWNKPVPTDLFQDLEPGLMDDPGFLEPLKMQPLE